MDISRTTTKKLAPVAALAVLALALAGCAKEDTSTTTESGIKLVEDGALTICTHLPYEPFEFEKGGKPAGFFCWVGTDLVCGVDDGLAWTGAGFTWGMKVGLLCVVFCTSFLGASCVAPTTITGRSSS